MSTKEIYQAERGGPVKKKYLVCADIESAQGSQTWTVEAETEEEAIEIMNGGGGEFDCEEVEVTALGPYYIGGEEEIEPEEKPTDSDKPVWQPRMMGPRKITVISCSECPYTKFIGDFHACNHPLWGGAGAIISDTTVIDPSCPLEENK